MNYRMIITVNSDKEHAPVQFAVTIPDGLALILMKTPVTSVRLAISQGANILDKSKLLDFK